MRKKDISNEQKIYECVHRRMHKFFRRTILVCAILLIAAILFDCGIIGCKQAMHLMATLFEWDIECVETVMQSPNFFDSGLNEWIHNVTKIFFDNIEAFFDMLITIDTILAAAVIFYYSVQDNRKEGIPHRAILAYSFGSYTIPVFFLVAMLLLPVGFWLFRFNMNLTFAFCTLAAYFYHMMVIALILVSTSQSFGQHVISNAEIRQYWLLCDMDIDIAEKENAEKKDAQNNYQSVWTYLMHYLEQAVMSDELLSDKMMLIRELLRTPYYEKELSILQRQKSRHDYGKGMAVVCLEKNSLKRIYEFYYGNISSVMGYLNKMGNDSERDKIYMVLYEFLKELQKLYQEIKITEGKEFMAADKNYMMTVSGIMNAVLESRAPDAEGFCNYIFNKCMEDRKIREKQIGLYFLFQEYLYRTRNDRQADNHTMPIEHVQEIKGIANWSMEKDEKEKRLYYDFWQIWMSWTTASDKNSRIYFRDAMATLQGQGYDSCPISYIMLYQKNMERNTDEDKSDSAD